MLLVEFAIYSFEFLVDEAFYAFRYRLDFFPCSEIAICTAFFVNSCIYYLYEFRCSLEIGDVVTSVWVCKLPLLLPITYSS